MDFPVSRKIIACLDDWLTALAAPLLPAHRVPIQEGNFQWKFKEETPEVVQVAKAVRMISGIRAALLLVDNGFTTECATLLRVVSECSHEIIAIGEGLIEGRLTESQLRFVRQYFAPIAQTPEELEQREMERYVSRDEMLKAHSRLIAKHIGGEDWHRRVSRFLNYGFDKYVHAAYPTSMELYTGSGHRFMLNGHESERYRCIVKSAVAGKLHEVIVALEVMAISRKDGKLRASIALGGAARQELDESDEQSGTNC